VIPDTMPEQAGAPGQPRPRPGRLDRVRLGFWAVVLASVFLTGFRLAEVAFPGEAGGSEDPLVRLESRLAPVRPFLPERGVVGYLTDTQAVHGSALSQAQYVLAPLVLVGNLQPRVLVGNFSGEYRNVLEELSTLQYRLRYDSGTGVFVMERRLP